MRRASILILVLCLGVAFGAGRASAQTGDDFEAQVKAAIATGTKHYKAKEYKEALESFLKAHTLVQEEALMYNIARCYEELGEYDNAIFYYQQFVQTTKSDKAKDKATKRIKECKEAKTFGMVFVKVSEADATIKVAGQKVGKSPLDKPLEIKKGTYKIEILKKGFLPWKGEVQVTASKMAMVDVTLEPVAVTKPPVVEPPVGPVVKQKPGIGPLGIAGWSTLGGAVLLAIGGGILHASAESDYQEALDMADEPAPIGEKTAYDLRDSGDTKATAEYVLFGLAGAAVIGSGVMLYLEYLHEGSSDTTSDNPQSSALDVWMAPTEGGASLWLTVAF